MPRFARRFLLAAALLTSTAFRLDAQTCVSLSTLGVAYNQNFDALSNVAASTTNDLTIPGWFLSESGGGARDNEQYAVDNGASTTGDTYSYGSSLSTDRALGGLQSGTLIPTVGACFTNDTGENVLNLAISYTGEEWRLGTAGRTDRLDFQYSLDATDLNSGAWSDHNALDFTTPVTTTVGAKDGNNVLNQTAVSSTVVCLAVPDGADFWLRWSDLNATSSDDGLAVDSFSLTPSAPSGACLTVDDVTVTEGEAGTVLASFTVSLTEPAAGTVTFDIATADGTATTADNDYVVNALAGQSITAGNDEYIFDVTVNGDTNPEIYETFLVNVTNVTGATIADGQGLGLIETDDFPVTPIHDVQGNGAASPVVGEVHAVEGIVTASFQSQGSGELRGFFLQEEDLDTDADPLTSEGLFVFCSSCPTAVAEGARVRVTGPVSEFITNTQITASAAPAVVIIEAGNHLDEITADSIDLPVVGDVDDFYEARENMLVAFADTLTVAEYFELFRYGQIELYEGGRPRQFTEANAPDVDGYADHLAELATRRVIVDDDDNSENVPLNMPAGFQHTYHPSANGGFSSGTQGTDYFRGGDTVSGLTGVLHWSGSGAVNTDAWRIRPTAAHPVTLSVANPRPANVPPAVGDGTLNVASMNLLNYFSTVDTTSSGSSGPCGPDASQDCRGADSAAELARQQERAALVICTLDADVYGLVELENTTASGAIDHLLTAVNASCGGADPYQYASTGGTLGTDAIRVAIIYRSATLEAVGAPLVDNDGVHNRPPTAQTFEVIEPGNPALGEVFTVVVSHFKSKGSCPDLPDPDADQGDGQGCFAPTREDQADRLVTWVNGTVIPAAPDDDPDVLLLGDFNAYAQETAVTSITGAGYVDLMSSLLGSAAYSYLFDGQLGHLDYAFASPSMAARVSGIAPWHINADEVPLLDYNDEIRDTGESSFEEKPDGSALTPARNVFEPSTPYRAADHDPVLVGLFVPPADLSPALLSVDDNGNGVLELGDTIALEPSWHNASITAAEDVEGDASRLTPEPGVTYDFIDAEALYGDIAPGVTVSCASNSNCYAVEITGSRPQQHFDAAVDEELSSGETHSWTLHVGESFLDVADDDAHYAAIETFYHHSLVVGCGGGRYCPDNLITRGQLALFLMRAIGDAIGPCDEFLDDVKADNPYCAWIEELYEPDRQITAGCGGNNFCPDNPVTRGQMAKFLLRAVEGPAYAPDACDATPFDDVPEDHPYCSWIQELKNRGATASCDGGTNFCPDSGIARAPFISLLQRAYQLELYEP